MFLSTTLLHNEFRQFLKFKVYILINDVIVFCKNKKHNVILIHFSVRCIDLSVYYMFISIEHFF
jgi:hypothetical protein